MRAAQTEYSEDLHRIPSWIFSKRVISACLWKYPRQWKESHRHWSGLKTEDSLVLRASQEESLFPAAWLKKLLIHWTLGLELRKTLPWLSSVAQPCQTLCNPTDCSTPGFLVYHQLPELTQTHAHWVGDAIQPPHPTVVPFSYLQSFPASGSFQMSQFITSGGQSIVVSASTSVCPMNIHDWFPLRWTGWISLQFKVLSRVFSNTTVQKHQFFGTQLF